MNIVLYGLSINGKTVKCGRTKNQGDFCSEETVRIDGWGLEDWLVEDRETVMKVLDKNYVSPPWYNSSMESPIVEIDLSEAKVIKITTTVTVEEV